MMSALWYVESKNRLQHIARFLQCPNDSFAASCWHVFWFWISQDRYTHKEKKKKNEKNKGGIWWSPLLPKGEFIAFNLKTLPKLLLRKLGSMGHGWWMIWSVMRQTAGDRALETHACPATVLSILWDPQRTPLLKSLEGWKPWPDGKHH